jgi:hypothetical protein
MVISMRRSKSLFSFAFCLLWIASYAQPLVSVQEMKKKYPDAHSLVLKSTESFEVDVTKKGLKVISVSNLQIMYLNEKGISDNFESIAYDPNFYTIENLQAQTWVPKDGAYKRLAVTEIKDVQEVDDENFYNSRRFKQFRYPGVQNGAITEVSYSYDHIDARLLGQFSLAFRVPAEHLELTFSVPEGVELGIAQFGSKEGVEYSTETKGKRIVHRWKATQVAKFKGCDFCSSDDHYRPHIYVYIKSYVLDGKKVTVQGSVDDLYKLNYSHIKDLKEPVSDAIRQVVDSIKGTSSADEQVVKGIFYWVQDHVRYIAFEDGMGGVVPRKANQVCDKRYGDCKDMANLIKEMMDYAGIPGYLCWIGTRSKGYTYSELPLPYVDNHMIAAYKKGNEYIFLDATSKHHPFGLPSIGIQGKETMISLGPDAYEIVIVPVVNYSKNFVKDSVQVTLENKVLSMRGELTMGGYAKMQNAEKLDYSGPQKQKEEWLDILERGNNKCKLDNYTLRDWDNRDVPGKVEYTLLLNDYVREINDEMYINFNFDRSLTSMKPDTTKGQYDADFYFTFHDQSHYSMKVPIGYEVKKTPNNVKIENDRLVYTVDYTVENGEVRVSKEVKFKDIYIPAGQLKSWIADLDKVAQSYQQVVVFSKQ